ncbi:hypothetical protein KP509_11G054200 [Ceratopteris richardii]|uniref:Uncharacterized protein n=1 Tax=Ceratopteris richardii TaxID=49495 RepID=A0A8T2TVG7_CERRI|nr:hypothetical protein KP509_11G054200 [Ceratopteris richardii]
MEARQQEKLPALKFHNPFTVRVGQVFTGFGVGCGIGIGVGRPINIRAVPVIGNVAGEAIGTFSSLRPYVDSLGKKLGIKNIQAGVGCGLGIGHGFGVGVALKPGTTEQLKQLAERVIYAISERIQSFRGSSDVENSSNNHVSSDSINERKVSLDTDSINERKVSLDTYSHGSTPIQSLENFMQNTSMATKKSRGNQEPNQDEVNRLQTENKILLTLLTHKEDIELLKTENDALRQAFSDSVDPSSRLNSGLNKDDHDAQNPFYKIKTKCFECRRRARQR